MRVGIPMIANDLILVAVDLQSVAVYHNKFGYCAWLDRHNGMLYVEQELDIELTPGDIADALNSVGISQHMRVDVSRLQTPERFRALTTVTWNGTTKRPE